MIPLCRSTNAGSTYCCDPKSQCAPHSFHWPGARQAPCHCSCWRGDSYFGWCNCWPTKTGTAGSGSWDRMSWLGGCPPMPCCSQVYCCSGCSSICAAMSQGSQGSPPNETSDFCLCFHFVKSHHGLRRPRVRSHWHMQLFSNHYCIHPASPSWRSVHCPAHWFYCRSLEMSAGYSGWTIIFWGLAMLPYRRSCSKLHELDLWIKWLSLSMILAI